MTHLHFTFGPVQGFVAQARRTRDLYAGSFLLSHLALKAMEAAATAGGNVILPAYGKLKALAERPDTRHALAPNRFVAEFKDGESAAEAGRAAAKALRAEWTRIAETVWGYFLVQIAAQGRETRNIWDRQIQNFWEIAWVVGDEKDTALLDRRKNWRTPPRTVEPGDHCTLMGQWQELSGFIRSKERQPQEDFWAAVRGKMRSQLDLEDDERLCAIALVKRLFPLLAKAAIGRDLDMENWPSTVSVAAVPWLKQIKTANAEVLQRCRVYAERVRNEPGARVSSARRIQALRDFPASAGEFANLSGNFLNRTALENERGTLLNDNSKARRDHLLDALRDLEKATGGRAGNFYALLLMDGDSMGKLIREHSAEPVTPCLTRFASRVPGLIETAECAGICVYAGGDDLLAMLPLDSALAAVVAARQAYREAFRAGGVSEATISAGLVFAHYRCAFSRVLTYAHELLDDVAKEGAGRDAIAMGLLKPGGVACQWVGKFDHFIQNGSHCFQPLIQAYQKEANREGRGLSSSFLYNLRERFAQLFGEQRATNDRRAAGRAPTAEAPFDDDTLTSLFVAEYLHGRLDKDPAKANEQREAARQLMDQLIAVCWQADARCPNQRRFDLDGARLVKFLALDGKEGAE
jgi:CRISPR-associated protein Cmr2